MNKKTKTVLIVVAIFVFCGVMGVLFGEREPEITQTEQPKNVKEETKQKAEEKKETPKEEKKEEKEEKEEESDGEYHIYNSAQIRPAMSGNGENRIGEYSYTLELSEMCTDELLADYLKNYVEPNKDKYMMFVIEYTDKEGMGIVSSGSTLSKDVTLTYDETSNTFTYEQGEDNNLYYVDENGGLAK